jgi:hypothetical protein
MSEFTGFARDKAQAFADRIDGEHWVLGVEGFPDRMVWRTLIKMGEFSVQVNEALTPTGESPHGSIASTIVLKVEAPAIVPAGEDIEEAIQVALDRLICELSTIHRRSLGA